MIIKQPNNEHIMIAIEKLDSDNTIVSQKNGKKVIKSKYNSYIASFGGSIIQTGLLATLMIFEANDEKNKIIQLLFDLLNHNRGDSDKIHKSDNFYYKTISNFNKNKLKEIRNELIDLAVALKLAMRCYEQVDNQKE